MLSPKIIAHDLPDIPRLLEVRSYLFSDECEVLGYAEQPTPSFVLRIAEENLAYIVGEPADSVIINAISGFGTEGTIITPQDQFARLAPLLPDWKAERIFVYTLQDTQHLPDDEQMNVRFLDANDLVGTDIDPELLEELEDALGYTTIAAVYVAGRPVSFCYASSQTETLWDVGIDTVPEHQRKGYAGLCFSFMARYMQEKGKTTVWQALESNPPSWLLAESLGFTKVDELAYFTKI
jgi:RimJ/RimL family protein N-acetyltransferase